MGSLMIRLQRRIRLRRHPIDPLEKPIASRDALQTSSPTGTSKRPERGLWPADVRSQADVVRWLAWESAHWDAESLGMVTYEKNSKRVLGLGAPDPAFIARGEENFARFAAVLDGQLEGRAWITGERIAASGGLR